MPFTLPAFLRLDRFKNKGASSNSSSGQAGCIAIYAAGGQLFFIQGERRQGENPRIRLLHQCDVSPSFNDVVPPLKKNLGLANAHVTTVLPGGAYQLVVIETPTVPREEWKDALRWEVKDLVDWPEEEILFDVLDIPTAEYAPTRTKQCYLVVTQRSTLNDRFGESLLDPKLLNSIDIPEMAQRNLAALYETEGRGLAMLAFDEFGGLLTITYRNELYVSRRLDVQPGQYPTLDEQRRTAISERMALEIQRTLDSCDRQYSFMTINRLMIFGWDGMDSLQDDLSSLLYLPVEQVELEDTVDFEEGSPLAEPALQARLAYGIGAALREV